MEQNKEIPALVKIQPVLAVGILHLCQQVLSLSPVPRTSCMGRLRAALMYLLQFETQGCVLGAVLALLRILPTALHCTIWICLTSPCYLLLPPFPALQVWECRAIC